VGPASGKMKIFGSYGVVNDVMKLLLAQTSWGAQVFENCVYALGPDASGTFTIQILTRSSLTTALAQMVGQQCQLTSPAAQHLRL